MSINLATCMKRKQRTWDFFGNVSLWITMSNPEILPNAWFGPDILWTN